MRSGTDAVYVHLSGDGGVFVVDGETGAERWTGQGGLDAVLDRVAERSGTLLYTRDDPRQQPPELVVDAFAAIAGRGLPLRLLPEPHPRAVKADGLTTLMAAAHADDLTLVQDLLRRGAPHQSVDVEGMTALHYAAHAGGPRVVKALVEAGADPNRPDGNGATPIDHALARGDAAVGAVLLAAAERLEAT